MSADKCFGIINGLRKIQAREYSYEEFFHILKRRIRIFTGREEVMFYNELQVCTELITLGLVKP